MRAAVERSLPLMLLITWVVVRGAIPDGPARTAVSWALGAATVVACLLWLLSRVALPRVFSFGERPRREGVERLHAHAASLCAAGFTEGPPRLVVMTPGTSMHALPLVYPARSTWALAMEDVGRTQPPALELLTCFRGGLRVSTMDSRLGVTGPRPRHALVQVEHGGSVERLWRAHEHVVTALEDAGLEPEPVEPGAFEELFTRSTTEALAIASERPLTVTAATVWRLYTRPRPEERPLFSQPAALAVLREHGVDTGRLPRDAAHDADAPR